MLRRAVELEPSSYDFAFALGDFLLRRGRFAEVVEVADRMTAIDASRPEAAQLRSRAGRRGGDQTRPETVPSRRPARTAAVPVNFTPATWVPSWAGRCQRTSAASVRSVEPSTP